MEEWVSKEEWKKMLKRVADLEEKVQSQQEISQRPTGHLELLVEQVAHDTPSDFGDLKVPFVLDRKRLIELLNGPKQ